MEGARTIGVVGGGQLGRMLTLAALPLGFRVAVVETDEQCPAGQAGAFVIKGGWYEVPAIKKLAAMADVVTIEVEHIDTAALQQVAALGTPVHPAPQTVSVIQDKLRQKEFLQAAGIPVAPFAAIQTPQDAEKVRQQFGGKILIKTRRGGYDGRGNMAVTQPEHIGAAFQKFSGHALYAEQFFPFTKELAVMVARSTNGEIAAYPVTETIHRRNICVETLSPAGVGEAVRKKARDLAIHTVSALDAAGVFGIEMFLGTDGSVLVNEIAPRVHNSGHYTMDACRTSQFEQHIRAITGLPLGAADLIAPAAVMINILGERDGPTVISGLDKALAVPHTSVHLYGKQPTKIDRKMGHITATGNSLAQARNRARRARKHIGI